MCFLYGSYPVMGLTLRLARGAFEAFGREYKNVLSADNVRLPLRCEPRRGIAGLAACKDTSNQNEERATQLFEYRSVR